MSTQRWYERGKRMTGLLMMVSVSQPAVGIFILCQRHNCFITSSFFFLFFCQMEQDTWRMDEKFLTMIWMMM